jgi:hypothetical protein
MILPKKASANVNMVTVEDEQNNGDGGMTPEKTRRDPLAPVILQLEVLYIFYWFQPWNPTP